MRRWIAIVAALVCTACGSGSINPNEPSTTGTRLVVLEGTMDFGTIQVGQTFEAVLRIYNRGTEMMFVASITLPAGYTASWMRGEIQPGTSQASTIRFTPAAVRDYNGTITVEVNATGTKTMAVSGRGERDLFRRDGVGDTVFDMPLDVARVHVRGTFTGGGSNFVVRVGGRLLVNEIIGTRWPSTVYDGTLATGGGGVVEVRLSSGVVWLIEEIRP
jgi:Protein of unknown function (DUF1573)